MYALDFDEEEVHQYLGFRGHTPDEQTIQDMIYCKELLQKEARPQVISKVLDLEPINEENVIPIQNTNFALLGNDMQALLKDCKKCIFMAVTLGQTVDNLLRKLQVMNMTHAVVCDCCASSMVEQLCNQFEDDLKKDWTEQGFFFTDRFSAGYGDFPLHTHKAFCDVLETPKKIGLNVMSNHFLTPKKSITAVIGIADRPQRMKIKGCAYCSFADTCQIRKGGKTCG